MDIKKELNEIFQNDTECVLSEFKVGQKFILDGEESFVVDVSHVLYPDGSTTCLYILNVGDGRKMALYERELWLKLDEFERVQGHPCRIKRYNY